jgi:hypothetical protein
VKKTQQTPYSSLPERSFWRTAIADRAPADIDRLWEPKFEINDQMRVSTYGSCFAQHIGRNLKARGYNWFRPEGVPQGLSKADARKFNYGVFPTRTGNLYPTSLLLQWLSWADGSSTPPCEIWEKDGRYYDPFRPAIEPDGFETPEELNVTRQETIDKFRLSVVDADLFVFTLGLTESWWNAEHGYEYPMCPGTAAGEFDDTRHRFVNQSSAQVLENMSKAVEKIRTLNPDIRVLLTVSPVPLTATASGQHVLVATTYSKSVLRAVAGEFAQTHDWIDYFPSYEIVTAPPFGGSLYADNKRSMKPEGVSFVMDRFFASLQADDPNQPLDATEKVGRSSDTEDASDESDDLVCEEILLDAFGQKR